MTAPAAPAPYGALSSVTIPGTSGATGDGETFETIFAQALYRRVEPTRVPFVVVLPDKPAELAERETVPASQRTILAAELVCGAKQGACSIRT